MSKQLLIILSLAILLVVSGSLMIKSQQKTNQLANDLQRDVDLTGYYIASGTGETILVAMADNGALAIQFITRSRPLSAALYNFKDGTIAGTIAGTQQNGHVEFTARGKAKWYLSSNPNYPWEQQ